MSISWNIKNPSQEAIDKVVLASHVSPLLARLLINRGIEEERDIQHFLYDTLGDLPSPFLLKGCDIAVERIIKAIHQKQKIVIYGDYDVDGTCGTALLISFFREIGFEAAFYIPHRLKEGYSLNKGAVERLKKEGAQLLITVDNGIAANAEIAFANELGLDVIVTDHHEIPPQLPAALAVLNPLQQDCAYPQKTICGSGVAFNLMMALRSCLRDQGYFVGKTEPNLKRYLDLVAIATVADVVPLKGANRIFVKYGLDEIRQTRRLGLVHLKKVAGVDGEVTASHLGFRLGPRLNACGRLYDAASGVKLLITQDNKEAEQLATALDSDNRERQVIEDEILTKACAMVADDPKHTERLSHVLFDETWHPGVVGIVASRIVSRFHRPTIVLGRDKDIVKGSARSFGGLNMVEALRACSSVLVKCGGHKAAAGLTLTPENVKKFQELFEQEVRMRLSYDDCKPTLAIDAEIQSEHVNKGLVDELKFLEPHGQGNPEPVFCLRSVRAESPRLVGDSHLKFHLSSPQGPLDAIAFRMADRKDAIKSLTDLAFSCEINRFRGVEKVQLNIKDISLP